MKKLEDFFHQRFPKSMGQGQQTKAEFLSRNGWEKQAPQGESPVWKCPVTGDNFLEPEALRRAEQRPFEDRAIVIVTRVLKDRDALRKQVADLTPKPAAPAGGATGGAAGAGGAAS